MGCYGYICPKCGKNIRGGELCVLRNVRHGVVIDEIVGHYNEYGGVEESETFDVRSAGASYFDFEDSMYRCLIHRTDNGEQVTWGGYLARRMEPYNKQLNKAIDDIKAGKQNVQIPQIPSEEDIKKDFLELPKLDMALVKSGVSAYHKYCFDRLSDEEKEKNICSVDDPEQSWGKPRKKYM